MSTQTAVIDPVVRARHDELLAALPPGAEHDDGACPVCALAEGAVIASQEDIVDEAQIAERIRTAVAEATGPLTARIAELEGADAEAARQAEIAQAVEAATAPLTARVAELENELDVRTAERDSAVAARADLETFLTEAAAEAAREAEVAARRDERVAQIAEVVTFDDETVNERADRWAAMEDAEFASFLDDLRAANPGGPRRSVTPPSPFGGERRPKPATAAAGSRTSAMREAMAHRKSITR